MNRTTQVFPLPAPTAFKQKAFAWAQSFETACYFDHNGYVGYANPAFNCLLAVGAVAELRLAEPEGAFIRLKSFVDQYPDWLFGHLSYDLKNDVENLSSTHPDPIGFPALCFFRPLYVIEIQEDSVNIHSLQKPPQAVFEEILAAAPLSDGEGCPSPPLQAVMPRSAYLEKVRAIQRHIQLGDIYEMNLCQAFIGEGRIHPPSIFQRLNELSASPFSAYYKLHERYLLCSSPERFLRKKGQKLTSQPIKGTMRRGGSEVEDALLASALATSPKDRSENVMIVDLVRNDLARTCLAGSVQVEELCKVYRFRQVLQLVSTITGQLRPGEHAVDAIRQAFPMGSMTGAPKLRSMQLIEQYENMRRGLYSGAVGYFMPNGDFDFNVVIRSILYNAAHACVAVQVGGAIVAGSVPESEFEECMLKAKSMFSVLS